MIKRLGALSLAVLMLASLFCSCAGTAKKGTVSLPDVLSGRTTFVLSQPDLYDPALVPTVEPYTIDSDFGNVINRDDLLQSFSDEAKQMLLQNGFVVLDGTGEEFFGLYESNRYQLMPSFITADSMMHTYHLYFSRLLKGIETTDLYGALIEISKTMQQQSLTQYKALKGTEWESAALRNVAFFSVGLSLLMPDSAVPSAVQQLVEQELLLIEQAAEILPSPCMNIGEPSGDLMPLDEDYSQYIPRGYYTTSEELTRYFKAMMWYGRLTFREQDADQSRSALLLTTALATSDAAAPWEQLYTITSFFAGVSDDAGIFEYAPLITKSYGGWPNIQQLPKQQAEWDAFTLALATLDPPAINSIPIYDKSIEPDAEAATKGFRFVGQRFTLDAAVFQQLIYRSVDKNSANEARSLPAALDFPAALGSPLALEILSETGVHDFPGYTEHMTQMKNFFADAPESLWSASLYGGWINTLRPLTQEKGTGYPQFMQTKAWAAKDLSSFLGSWTELKHDTVLYAKQVYSEMGGGGTPEPVDDRGYVEPEPVLYARLASLAQATSDGLEHYGVLQDADAENLARMSELARRLLTIAEKELQNQLLTEDEYDLIRTFGGQLEHFWYEALKDEVDSEAITTINHPAALVTDVATDPNGVVLEVASGRIDDLYVIVPVDGVLRIAHGGVFSFYEFEQPLSDRLTDEVWRKMLGIDMFDETGQYVDARVDVPHPDWTALFRLPRVYGG